MSLIFNLTWWLIVPFLFAKLIVSIALIFLDVQDLNLENTVALTSKSIYTFPKFFSHKITISQIEKKEPTDNLTKIDDISLSGVYLSKTQKFVMIKDKTELVFVALNHKYRDIKLVKIGLDYAKFLRDGKYITLHIQDEKEDTETKSQNSTTHKPKAVKKSDKQIDSGYITIKRTYFDRYTKDINSFFRDIRIKELRRNREFDGVQINFVRKGSMFDKMGLQKGDIIKEIDGKRIVDMKELFNYYGRLKNITSLKVGLQRGEDIKEIIYEID